MKARAKKRSESLKKRREMEAQKAAEAEAEAEAEADDGNKISAGDEADRNMTTEDQGEKASNGDNKSDEPEQMEE